MADDEYEYRSSGRERKRKGETRDLWEPTPTGGEGSKKNLDPDSAEAKEEKRRKNREAIEAMKRRSQQAGAVDALKAVR